MKTSKEKIIQASALLFALQGYDKTTVRDIAKLCGITASTLFSHFRTKDEIRDAAAKDYILNTQKPEIKFGDVRGMTLRQFLSHYANRIMQTMEELTANLDRVKDIMEIDGEQLSNKYLMFVMDTTMNMPNIAIEFRKIDNDEINLFRGIIEQAQANGEVRSDMPAQKLAEMFRHNFWGLAHISALSGGLKKEKLETEFNTIYSLISYNSNTAAGLAKS